MSKFLLILVALGMSLVVCRDEAWAGNYRYNELMAKTYDEMLEEVKTKVQSAEEVQEDSEAAIARLSDAMEMVLSRPDRDNMVYQLVPFIRTPLRNFNAFESTISKLADRALATFKAEKKPAVEQVTAYFVLLNIMSEMKPDIKNKKEIRKMFNKIKDAKIKVSKNAEKELRLNAMSRSTESPSRVAETILKSAK